MWFFGFSKVLSVLTYLLSSICQDSVVVVMRSIDARRFRSLSVFICVVCK